MKKKEAKKDERPGEAKQWKIVAKKDFKIVQNEYERNIVKGEDISDVPERYWQNLKTEGVL